jgi:hypothetical protein
MRQFHSSTAMDHAGTTDPSIPFHDLMVARCRSCGSRPSR